VGRCRSGSANSQGGSKRISQRGPNLTLIYSLIVLAMLATIAFTALIVLPYYNRR
jgi:hypothetical protein